MITLICATNRPGSLTLKVVKKYRDLLMETGQDISVLSMGDLPGNFLVDDSFGNRTSAFEDLLLRHIEPASRFVVVAPEYNGSYPGVFKAFLDALDPGIFRGKKAALVGVSAGRAGNLRGLDHLTQVLHHLEVEVFSNKVPISVLHKLLDDSGVLVDSETEKVLRTQIESFLRF